MVAHASRPSGVTETPFGAPFAVSEPRACTSWPCGSSRTSTERAESRNRLCLKVLEPLRETVTVTGPAEATIEQGVVPVSTEPSVQSTLTCAPAGRVVSFTLKDSGRSATVRCVRAPRETSISTVAVSKPERATVAVRVPGSRSSSVRAPLPVACPAIETIASEGERVSASAAGRVSSHQASAATIATITSTATTRSGAPPWKRRR